MAPARRPVKRNSRPFAGVQLRERSIFREAAMRLVLASALLAAMGLASTPAAAQGSWCAEDMNARNCGFYTLEQCQAAASGNGARCDFNFAQRTPAAEAPKRKKRAKQ
jgi:Protein of unknown function (DUF3551)